MEYTFTIDGKNYNRTHVMPSLNNYIAACGKSPMVGARMKKEYMRLADWQIRSQLHRLAIRRPIKIHYVLYEANRKRDFMNVLSFADKVIEDSLQECGVIPNDNQEWVHGVSVDFKIDCKHPRIEVTLEEICCAEKVQ